MSNLSHSKNIEEKIWFYCSDQLNQFKTIIRVNHRLSVDEVVNILHVYPHYTSHPHYVGVWLAIFEDSYLRDRMRMCAKLGSNRPSLEIKPKIEESIGTEHKQKQYNVHFR